MQSDLEALVSNCVQESKLLEYKSELKIEARDDKKEFLADLSAMANTHGGQIIYGISEKDGIPTSVTGIEIDIPDDTIQKIEN